MLLISFVVVMLSVILCMYVCSSIREERLCQLLELNKLIIQIKSNSKIDRLQEIPGVAHVTTQQYN